MIRHSFKQLQKCGSPTLRTFLFVDQHLAKPSSSIISCIGPSSQPSIGRTLHIPAPQPLTRLRDTPVYSNFYTEKLCLSDAAMPVQAVNSCPKKKLHTSRKLCDSIPKSRALTLIKELKEVKHSPAPALVLGLSGLIPFISAPVYMIFTQAFSPVIAFAQIAYGATILSFLGGVRWGLTLPEDSVVRPDWTNLGYSVAPSLVAWLGLLLPEPLSIFTLMGGLGAAAYFDTAMYGYPLWFKGLRFVLSLVAVLSLWTTFMCRYIISDKHTKDQNEKQE